MNNELFYFFEGNTPLGHAVFSPGQMKVVIFSPCKAMSFISYYWK